MVTDFVIDNSVVMTWCFEEETSPYSDYILDILQDAIGFVPSIWPLELCNVLLVSERRRRISEADSARFISLVSGLPIRVEQESQDRMMKEILALARAYNLTSYDASYLDLAMKKGLPIATFDQKLLSAAKQTKVPII